MVTGAAAGQAGAALLTENPCLFSPSPCTALEEAALGQIKQKGSLTKYLCLFYHKAKVSRF